MLHELVEHALRVGIHEAVVLELADLTRDVGREGVQRSLTHPRTVSRLERQARTLAIQDLVEAPAELLQRTCEVQPRLLLVAQLLEPAAERVETTETALHAAPHQSAERRVGRVAYQDVVRELLQDVGRRHVVRERILRTVPAGVAEASHPSRVRRFTRSRAPSSTRGRRARSR